MGFFSDSTGTKRKIAAILTTIFATAQADPLYAPILPFILVLADMFGVVGLAHAAAKDTIKSAKSLSVAAALPLFLTLITTAPALAAYRGTISLVTVFISAIGLSLGAKKKK